MTIKAQCDAHGCSEMLCGCHITSMESSSDFHEMLRAKDKWISKLLDQNYELEERVNELQGMREKVKKLKGIISEL